MMVSRWVDERRGVRPATGISFRNPDPTLPLRHKHPQGEATKTNKTQIPAADDGPRKRGVDCRRAGGSWDDDKEDSALGGLGGKYRPLHIGRVRSWETRTAAPATAWRTLAGPYSSRTARLRK